jgi:hypothetical protein
MSNNYRPQGSEKIQDPNQKLERIKVIAGITPSPIINENKFNTKTSTVLHEAIAADGQQYGLIQEGPKVYVKRLVNDHYEYLTGDEKDYAYKDFAQAFKHLNLLFKDINQQTGHAGAINIYEGVTAEKKNLTERFVLKAPKVQAPLNQDVPPSTDSSASPADNTMPQAPSNPQATQQVGQELSGAEDQVNEQDPTKAIQKMVGKLTELMRNADPQIMTSSFLKSILNSVISAIDVKKLEDADVLSIMKKLKGEDNPEAITPEAGENQDFVGGDGIDYNVNNPANSESGKPLQELHPLAEVLDMGEEEFLFLIPRRHKGSADYDKSKYYAGAAVWVTSNTDGTPMIAHITRIDLPTETAPGKAYGYLAPANSEENLGQAVQNANRGVNRANEPSPEIVQELNEEITEPSWDDQTMPNILGQVVKNVGVEVNPATENDVRNAVELFVRTYDSDQNQTGFMKELKDYLETSMNEGSNDAIAPGQLRYTSLSPTGQDVYDQLEILDPSMGELNQQPQQNDGSNANVVPMHLPLSRNQALAAESKNLLHNIIAEALKTK